MAEGWEQVQTLGSMAEGAWRRVGAGADAGRDGRGWEQAAGQQRGQGGRERLEERNEQGKERVIGGTEGPAEE